MHWVIPAEQVPAWVARQLTSGETGLGLCTCHIVTTQSKPEDCRWNWLSIGIAVEKECCGSARQYLFHMTLWDVYIYLYYYNIYDIDFMCAYIYIHIHIYTSYLHWYMTVKESRAGLTCIGPVLPKCGTRCRHAGHRAHRKTAGSCKRRGRDDNSEPWLDGWTRMDPRVMTNIAMV